MPDVRRRREFEPTGIGYEWPPVGPVPATDQSIYNVTNIETIVTQDEHQRTLLYKTPDTLDTTAGERFYAPLAFKITGVRASVHTAPTSTLTVDVLRNGSTIFPTATKPTITSGNLFGALKIPDLVTVAADDYLQVQLTATGGAVGPLTAYIDFQAQG